MRAFAYPFTDDLRRSDFGLPFTWGAATAAYQIEGAADAEGKGESIWDRFTARRGKIKGGGSGKTACDFYHRYEEDLDILQKLGFGAFRFSLSWTRILPQGTGPVNQKGIDFYRRLTEACLRRDMEPWITLYHWDLPQKLEEKGGWTNREILNWFSEYAAVCARAFSDTVRRWMILNEPLAFTAAGYLLGIHAPGRRGLKNFFPALHHAALCQAEGGRAVKQNVPEAMVGTTFSCAPVEPVSDREPDMAAAVRFDAVLNRLFIEPALGMGYPAGAFPKLNRIDDFAQPGDMERLKHDFDFIGLQNYTREVVRAAPYMPLIRARRIPAKKRSGENTQMNWEVYPEGMYKILKQFSSYSNIPEIVVTENGAAFEDEVREGRVQDEKRIRFFRDYLRQMLRAMREGVKVKGYFVWTLMDNFEWAEGYRPRFGIVYVDFGTQKRIVKDSGFWWREFLTR